MIAKFNLFRYILILLVPILFSISKANSETTLKVTIPQQGISLSYHNAPKLSQLLIDANKNIEYSAYPLGSALIKKNNNTNTIIQNTKTKLLEHLEVISNANTSNLRTIIENLNFFQQENITLDLERIQQNNRLNPIISGDYQLYLPKRPDFVILIDPQNFEKIVRLKLNAGYHLENYLRDHYKNKNFTTENIRIIQADKQVITPKINYWSSNKYYLSPGAIIYVGLNRNIYKAETINQNVTNLLQHHVVY
ncbi:hypothetical protein TW85_05505 [Marinomonas sp. S3726]|uniref:capsule biosynthesis GfcC D2 domain-containing protein n=1 Tax=Marinomonas sp. S3726 TaxID=579484 RepID=UPI0005FA694C|nr:capsule biosynthesis GfcC D2 domain-containing protein [Marinomonas sp. S3726]KJZ15074.1 hypothetical protein TW85_05505 [Marinomonas sp. S3726]